MQSCKGFKANLKVSKEELEKYLESWVLPNLVWFANLLHKKNLNLLTINLHHLLKHLMSVVLHVSACSNALKSVSMIM